MHELVNAVLQRCSAPVAGVEIGDPLNVAVVGEQLHEGGFDGFRMVEESLCADFDAADVELGEAEADHQVVQDVHAHGGHVFVGAEDADLVLA